MYLRFSLGLALLGTVVGLFFGVRGAVHAKGTMDSVNRKGGDKESMFHADRLDKGLDKVRAKVGADGNLLQLNIYPGYIQVDASTGSEDKGRSFRIQEDGRTDELPVTLTGPGKVQDNVFPFEKVDAKVVEKLATQAAAKEHTDLDDVSHVIVMIEPDSGKPGINVYLKNSRYWRAALDGSGLSNPDIDSRKALDGVEKTLDGLDTAAPKATPPSSANDLSTCISAAGTDAAKISACAK
jgi:hypothetical protein